MSNALIIGIAFVGLSIVIWVAMILAKRGVRNRSEVIGTQMEASLADAFVFVNRQKVAVWTMAGMVALPLLGFAVSGSLVIAAVMIPLALMAPKKVLVAMHRRRVAAMERQLPDVLLMLSGALRAGASFPVALESVVQESPEPISQELDLLIREIRLGVDLDIAMHNVEKRIPVQDFLMVTAAVTIAREVGGNLAEALESVARTLGAKLQMEGKIRALTAQGRMQGIVMTLLPVGLMLVLNWMEPEAMKPLFHEPVGWATLGAIAVMEFLGYKSISKITNIDV
ncbi:type II secretion system F family protein [Burkholderia pyrrocinia]|uniref:type II secretion system F family protein n=1 Tax=Burkholderia pyrrocinia TaxID=60550 RepID=UPI0010492AD7|nr:type II secretion system F family protein [Burkholderia pyrrocinia]TDA47467.1 secretion system protein F [Burkholderia pyrrocinia]